MTGVRLTAFRVSLPSTLIVVLLYVWAAQSTLLRNLEAKALIQVGSITSPSDESMRLLVNYLGPPGTFSTYAFVDVLQGRLPDATFRDAIVLIGGAASGLADTFVTPYTAALPGAERHATVIDSILRQDFLHRRDATALIDLAAIVIMGLLVGWLSPKCPAYWGSVAALGLGGMYAVANVLAFTWAGLWINLLFPLGAVAVNQSTSTLFKYLTEVRQKRLIRKRSNITCIPASSSGSPRIHNCSGWAVKALS